MAFMAVGIATVWLGMVLIVCHIWNWLRPKPEGEIHRSFMIGWSYAWPAIVPDAFNEADQALPLLRIADRWREWPLSGLANPR